jgi:preprotein translocase subunit SecG
MVCSVQDWPKSGVRTITIVSKVENNFRKCLFILFPWFIIILVALIYPSSHKQKTPRMWGLMIKRIISAGEFQQIYSTVK